MKTHILLGTVLALTLGTAFAGNMLYTRGVSERVIAPIQTQSQELPSADTIAMWKATAASTDFIAPKAPI